jgi:hypothetical protein
LDEVVAARLVCCGTQVFIEAGQRAGERSCVADDGPRLLVGEGLSGALPLGLGDGGVSPDFEPELAGGCLLGLGVEDGRCDLAVRFRVLPQSPDEGGDGVLGESHEIGLRQGGIERGNLGHLDGQETEEGLAAAQRGLDTKFVDLLLRLLDQGGYGSGQVVELDCVGHVGLVLSSSGCRTSRTCARRSRSSTDFVRSRADRRSSMAAATAGEKASRHSLCPHACLD